MNDVKHMAKPAWGWMTRLAMAATALVAAGVAYAGPQVEHWALDNGAQVYLVQSPSLPMLDVQVAFDAGSRRDPEDKTGLSYFAQVMADKGVLAGPNAAQEPAMDENALTDAWLDLGAVFSASFGRDEFSYSLRTLTYPDVLPHSIAMAARVIAKPSFPADVLKRERARSVASLKEMMTQPGYVAAQAYYPAVYSGHPYGAIETEQTLNAVTVADLQEHHTRYVVPCRARISMVGQVGREEANRIAEQLLSQLPAANCSALAAVPEVPPLAQAVDKNIAFKAAQAQILVSAPGIKRNDPDFLTLVVGNHILGGNGFSSRLMQEVREVRGLTYGVGSYFSPGVDIGAFTITLKTRPDQAEEALKVVRQVLADFIKEGPTQAELDAAKANLVGGFPLMFDSNAKLLGQVANIARNKLPLDYLNRWPDKIQAVTAEQIREAFARTIDPEKMVTVVVGENAP